MKQMNDLGKCEHRSILVVLPTWVGDLVMATPTLRSIRKRFAEARITFLMHPNLRELVRGGDWMDECIEWPAGNTETQKLRNAETIRRPGSFWDLVRALRSRQFDLAVLFPNSFRSALMARLSGARRRVGYDRDGRGLLLTDRVPVKNRRGRCDASQFPNTVRMGTKLPVRLGRYVRMPLVEYYADLAVAIGCERLDDRLELFTTPDCDESIHNRLSEMGAADRRPLIVLSPGAKFGAAKCWMPERFAAVADQLIESENTTVIVTCGPGEKPIARQIGAAMKNNRMVGPLHRHSSWKREGVGGFVFDDPLLTLGELKSLIRRSDLLIGNDAGPRHIAKAFNVPAVTVFGPTHPDWTATNYEKECIVRIDVDCGPCQQRICPLEHHQCMTGVTVDMVFAAASVLLRTHATQHAESR